MFDYQAEEDDELTLRPNDIITNIDVKGLEDTGWWMGTAPDGKRGVFPDNFVEIISILEVRDYHRIRNP